MSTFYFAVSGGPSPVEEITQWPSRCHVCLHERSVTKWSASRKKALKHRRKVHPWLADALDKARAVGGSR